MKLIAVFVLIGLVACEPPVPGPSYGPPTGGYESSNVVATPHSKGVKYAGPIVYTDEKPPVIHFPQPPIDKGWKSGYGSSHKPKNVKYIPIPHHNLPILVYQSDINPPIHVVNPPKGYNGGGGGYSSNGIKAAASFESPSFAYPPKHNVDSYSPPKEEYGPPSNDYGIPKYEFNSPKAEYTSAPRPEYGPPKLQGTYNSAHASKGLEAPKGEYGPPKGQYGPPKFEYGPPKAEYGPPKHSKGKKSPLPHIIYSGHPPIHIFQMGGSPNPPKGGGWIQGPPPKASAHKSLISQLKSSFHQGQNFAKGLHGSHSHVSYKTVQPPKFHTFSHSKAKSYRHESGKKSGKYIVAPKAWQKPPIIIYQGTHPPVTVYQQKGGDVGGYSSAPYSSYAAAKISDVSQIDPRGKQQQQQSFQQQLQQNYLQQPSYYPSQYTIQQPALYVSDLTSAGSQTKPHYAPAPVYRPTILQPSGHSRQNSLGIEIIQSQFIGSTSEQVKNPAIKRTDKVEEMEMEPSSISQTLTIAVPKKEQQPNQQQQQQAQSQQQQQQSQQQQQIYQVMSVEPQAVVVATPKAMTPTTFFPSADGSSLTPVQMSFSSFIIPSAGRGSPGDSQAVLSRS